MANFKFKKDQRVIVEFYGPGKIDVLPHNEESDVYGVWLDKPKIIVTSHGVVSDHWMPVPEKYMKSEN